MRELEKLIRYFKLNVATIENVPESYSSQVYKLKLTHGEQVYIKIPYNKDKLYREYRMLERLQDVVPVPRVLDIWDGDGEAQVGALLLSELKGSPCTGLVTDKLAYQFGELHAKLHSMSMPSYGVEMSDGFHATEQNDWRLYIKHNFETFIQQSSDCIDPVLLAKAAHYFVDAFSHLPEPDGPCVVHIDFRPGNILIRDNHVVGVIDFESVRSGATEIDFTKMNRYVWEANPSSFSSYKSGYTSVRPLIELEQVVPLYNVYDAVSAIVWCKKRGLDKNKAFLEENIAVLRTIVG